LLAIPFPGLDPEHYNQLQLVMGMQFHTSAALVKVKYLFSHYYPKANQAQTGRVWQGSIHGSNTLFQLQGRIEILNHARHSVRV